MDLQDYFGRISGENARERLTDQGDADEAYHSW